MTTAPQRTGPSTSVAGMPDVLVVGGGPVGLAAAIEARMRGLSVLLLEKRAGDIDKACGEGLMPGAVAALARLGVPLQGRPFHGIRYLDDRRSATAFFRSSSGLGVRRTTLQPAMVARARQLGVRVEQTTVTDLEQDSAGVTAGGLRARYLVAADGLHSPIRRMLGLDRPVTVAPRWGLRQHFRTAPWTRLVEVHWGRSSEAYVTPVGADEIGIAIVGSARMPWAEQLREFPRLAERVAGAPAAGSVRGAGPLRQQAGSPVAGRVLLVGDAAGYVDALTGEGIAVSLACARSLVDALVLDDPQRYARSWRRDSRQYRWITAALLATRRVAQPAIVPAASVLPDVFRMAVRQLAK
ncbi:MAG: Dehydrogenase (Flavoprotein) [Glaciihabitans sp.]|nr:Dehydrogenase (Flavoprotein) [Glaciihabitans sp.]